MKLTIVGCSGSYPGPSSAASCYLIEAHDDAGKRWRVVIDLGNGSLGTLQQHTALEDVDALVISHMHGDHFLDMCGLAVYITYRPDGQLPQMPLFAPETAMEQLRAASGEVGDSPQAKRPPFVHTPISDGGTFTIGPLTFESYSVDHPIDAYGFRIRCAGSDTVLAYSGDTDVCDRLDDIARGADLFLCEAAFLEGRDDAIAGLHLSGVRAGRVAKRAGVGRLVITHVPPWNDLNVLSAEVESEFGEGWVLAAPGQTYTV
ncbi:MBL fold metallo-hydrolase [Micrococcales bacterium 31B]|nr:MBL fold metallo-hydrolase [Micrococcales bacterium 31B]